MPSPTDPATGAAVRRGRFADLPPRRLHDLLRLRSAVFVVEQACAFLDLDGRDHEPRAEHLWVDDDHGVAATLRLLHEGGDRWSMGRICTRADVRSRGIASDLVRAGLARLDELGAGRVDIGAQAPLRGWYEGFGFALAGDAYVEDGIPHVPMSIDLGARR